MSIRKRAEMLQFERIPTQREQFHGCLIPLFISTLGFQDQQAKKLVEVLGNCPEIPVRRERGRPTIDLEIQLLITLWYLGNPECIRSV